MINDDQHNGYEASEILSIALNLWKLQPAAWKEVRICKIKPITNRPGELRLDLSISAVLCCNDMEKEVVVNALPFHTTTLGITTRNKDYMEECRSLKNLMDQLDDEFVVVIAEKNNHNFKNIV